MNELGIAVGIILVVLLALAGAYLPDNFARSENINFFYIPLAVLAAAVAYFIFREAER